MLWLYHREDFTAERGETLDIHHYFVNYVKCFLTNLLGSANFSNVSEKNGPHILRLVPKLMYTLLGYVSPYKVEVLKMFMMGGNV